MSDGKKILAVAAKSFCKGLQDYLLLHGPSYTQTIYSVSFVLRWSLGSEVDILIQSAANSNNALPLLKLTHLTSVIQLRAELHWPSCCDYRCLHEREVFTVGTAAPPLLLI